MCATTGQNCVVVLNEISILAIPSRNSPTKCQNRLSSDTGDYFAIDEQFSVVPADDLAKHSDMSEDSIHQPHDSLIKLTFAELETAAKFLKSELPGTLATCVDWDTLELEPGNFIDERYQRSSTDLLYKVKIADQESFVYCLFEHWSTQYHWIALRLLKYLVRIWEQHIQQNPGTKKLPAIIPVVLAQDNKEWKVPTQFSELLEIPEAIKDSVNEFLPSFTYRLIELANKPYEQIEGTPTGIMSLRVLRAASFHELLNDKVWDEELFEQISDEMVSIIMAYIQNGLSKIDDQQFQSKLRALKSNRLRKIAMTLTEKYIEDGALFGAIRSYQDLLGKNQISTDELQKYSEDELQTLHDQLKAEVRQKLRN